MRLKAIDNPLLPPASFTSQRWKHWRFADAPRLFFEPRGELRMSGDGDSLYVFSASSL
jgi:hypothetical protein